MPFHGVPKISSAIASPAAMPAQLSSSTGLRPARPQRSADMYDWVNCLKARSMAEEKRPRRMPLANSLEVIIGVSVSAMSAENTTAAATDTPNSLNSRPTLPCR